MPNEAERPRRVIVDRDGPVLIEGPVEFVTDDGTVVTSDRFVVAVCTCGRSGTYPWCDTSHRARAGRRREAPGGGERSPARGEGRGGGAHDAHDTQGADDTPDAPDTGGPHDGR